MRTACGRSCVEDDTRMCRAALGGGPIRVAGTGILEVPPDLERHLTREPPWFVGLGAHRNFRIAADDQVSGAPGVQVEVPVELPHVPATGRRNQVVPTGRLAVRLVPNLVVPVVRPS